jgi:two-component system phosphate regulon sensor histidine kinase PhoR
MKSNFKPLYFTIFASGFISLVSVLVLIVLQIGFYDELNAWILGIFALAIFFTTYLMIYLYFKFYLFRNINDILRSISHFTRSKKDLEYKSMNFKENVIESIDRQVKGWIDENKKEIDKYKILSDYRKQFLGDISHELKTPLFSVQGYLHTLKDGALFDEKHNIHFLEKAIKNADRLEAIVNDLDLISKYEAGEMKIVPIRFNVQQMFQDVFDELDYSASRKEIGLSFKPDSKIHLQAYADAKQIRHVCTNLISNAIHYGKTGGYVRVGIYPEPNKIRIEVSDNGIGIPEKHLAHLFDRFYRIDASRSRNKGGSGLGLSIVKHILNGHGQIIKVESTPGKGSTFTFTLNRAN